jgi:SAM-dependent methyltransferase
MGFVNRGFVYGKMVAKSFLRRPDIGNLFTHLKCFPAWNRYLGPGRSPLADKMPWITFSAIDFLKRVLHTDMRVFEYGSGGSTLFWARRVKELVSIEHNKSWFEKVKTELGQQGITNPVYILAEPAPDPDFDKKDFHTPGDYTSHDQNFAGMNFAAYVKTIDRYPDEYYDLIIIDGRARPSCIAHSLKKLKPGGWLVIDNTERAFYLAPFTFDRQNWKMRKFFGPVPYEQYAEETTILEKLK